LAASRGELYRQFAVTIAISSVVISGVVALTLTPAMCALLLDRQHGRSQRRFRFSTGIRPGHARPLSARSSLLLRRRDSATLLFGVISLTAACC
jgi:multidrug efflux pump